MLRKLPGAASLAYLDTLVDLETPKISKKSQHTMKDFVADFGHEEGQIWKITTFDKISASKRSSIHLL